MVIYQSVLVSIYALQKLIFMLCILRKCILIVQLKCPVLPGTSNQWVGPHLAGPFYARDNYIRASARLNSLCAASFWGKIKIIFVSIIIYQHRDGASSWNSSSLKAKTCLFYIVDVMAADALSTKVARASAAMAFILFSRNALASAHVLTNI